MGTSPDVAEAMPLKETPEKMALEKNDEDEGDNNKGGLISDFFFSLSISPKISAKSVSFAAQLNEYEAAPYLIQLSENLTSDCLLISVFLSVFTSFCK